MAAMTESEQRAWQRAYEKEQERRRIARTQPVTPANPIKPRQVSRGLRRDMPRQ